MCPRVVFGWRTSGGLERGDPWWRCDVDGGEDLTLLVAERGGLLDRAGRTAEGDELEALQLPCDLPPATGALALADADQEQGEPADQHVGADTVLEAVEDGSQGERPLEVAERALGLDQVLVAESDVFGGEIGVGGGEQVLPVQALLGGDLPRRSISRRPLFVWRR